MSDEKKDMTNSGTMSFVTESFAIGQRIGIKPASSSTGDIQKAIDALTSVPGDLTSILNTLFGAPPAGQMFGYDPSAKWLAGFSLIYGVLTLEVLLVDGEFYGLLIKVGKPPKPPSGNGGTGGGTGGGSTGGGGTGGGTSGGGGTPPPAGPFTGLELEIIYRKINDHLGQFSADLTLPDKFRKITMGVPPETTTITLPAISIGVWTNGDFSVSIGWPLGKRSFNIAFPPDPIPWAGGGGLYFAKLRSEDSPGKLGTNFNPILQFGIGLRIGAATQGNVAILSYAASLYLFGTFQGFLAWEEGHSLDSGVDYYWFCASVGITGHLEGTVDFVVIKVTVMLDITASVTMAMETGHATVAIADFTAKVTASIKILFFTVSFSYTLDLSIKITFGSGPPALITGPTPPSSKAVKGYVRTAALESEIVREALPAALTEVQLAATPSPIAVSLNFLLQPTIRYNTPTSKWLPVGVASLIIDRTPPANGNGSNPTGVGTDSFSLLIQSLANYLLQTYGNYTDPTATVTAANLSALNTALEAGQFNLQAIYGWLNASNIKFTVTGATSNTGADTSGALFPIIPGLVLTYNNQTTTFGDAAAPSDYLTALNNYFAKLSLVGDGSIDESAKSFAATAPPAPETWFPGVIFADYFNMLAKQLYQDLCNLGTSPTDTPDPSEPCGPQTPGTLAADLALIDIGNLAGIVTRFLHHGLRLPDPENISDPDDLLPLFELTGQQFDIGSDNNNNPVLSATLSGTTQVQVAISGTGTAQLPFELDQPPTASPLWSPQPLDRIKNVQLSFLLRQGVAWSQQQSATKTQPWMMFGFPDTLQAQLRIESQLSLTLSSTDGTAAPVAAPGLGGLMIGFSLSLIPQSNPPGTYLPSIFQVSGTDDATRDLMELLFADTSAMNDIEVDLLLPAGAPNSGAGFKTSTADAATLMVKTNLSTYNQPDVAKLFMKAMPKGESVPSLGPTEALITDAADFLRLLWECSIVHSGGFYLYVPDLAQSAFGNALEIDVALLVKSKSATAAAQVAVDNYQNTILVDATNWNANDRVQAYVFESDGTTPVTEPQPNYPAGTLAFGAVWNNAPSNVVASDTSAYATTLYQMLQFQIAGGNGLEDSGWSMPLGPDGDANTWTYRRAAPVYRFVTGASATPNRYGAIGIQTTLNLQLVDVFGNAFGLSPLKMAAVYNDPLIALEEWPGTSVVFAFNAGAGGNATLELTVTFQPDQVSEPKTALPYYQTIYDQLTDTHASITVTTALAAGPVALSSGGTNTQTALANFVAAIITYLNTQTGAPSPITLSGNVAINYVSQIGEDLFPLWVSLTITRTPTDSYSYPPDFLSITSQVPPLLNPNGDDTDPAALRNWAIGFEQAFNNFDSANGLLKVLTGTAPSKVTATQSKLGSSAAGDVTSTPGDLWALKWGEKSGVEVSFGNAGSQQPAPANQQPVYFAPLPLSTELVSGDVQINTYDSNGNKTTPNKQTFSGADMDELGRSFLQAVDSLLTPALATAIAQLDANKYNQLMTAKEELAYAISTNVSWVFADQMPPPQGGAGAGDLTSAQERFRDSLLASLGSDFATSVIVQMPASISVQNQFEANSDSSRPPDLFGNPTPTASTTSTSTTPTLNQYTISTATLPVTNGTGYLNFLVEAINPTINADLCLGFDYDIGFLDHQFETSEEQFGYTPSSWLRFVVPDTDPTGSSPVLDVSMGQLDIPIPLRSFPSPPRLVRQTAGPTSPTPTTIVNALQANYNLTVASPQVAQDDLHLSVEFNSATVNLQAGTDSGGALFAALANFQNFQAQYMTTAIQAITTNAASAEQWLTDIVELVQNAATAWQPEDEAAPEAKTLGADPVPPLPFTWDFILQVPNEASPNVLFLTWAGTGAAPSGVWPLIENTTGQPTNLPNEMQYTLPGGANLIEPTLSWQGLSVITNQNISTTAWIVRNETLASCGGKQTRTTNPDFVYTTATVTFPSPVIPLLQVTNTLTINATSVNDAVNQLVTGVMQPTTPVAQVGWGLQAEYSFVLVSNPNSAGQQLQTKLPVFLVRNTVTTDTTLPAGVESAQQFIAALESALVAWYGDFHPSDTNASLLFALTVFASDSQQPLARLLDIESPISGAGWWQAS